MSPDRPRRLQISPRLVVLGALLVSYAWALVFPLRLSRPPSGLLGTTYVVGLALFGGALALVLRSAVSPEQSQRTRIALVVGLVIVTFGLWLPAYAWAVPGQEPWAWMAGFAIGACVLAVPWAGVIAAVGLGAMAAAGAVVFDGSVVQNLGFALGSAAVVWLTGLVLVWLLGLVWAAEAGREAEADLVVAQERLRLGKRCTARRSPTWPPRSLRPNWSLALQASRPRSTSTPRRCQHRHHACWLPWSAKR